MITLPAIRTLETFPLYQITSIIEIKIKKKIYINTIVFFYYYFDNQNVYSA